MAITLFTMGGMDVISTKITADIETYWWIAMFDKMYLNRYEIFFYYNQQRVFAFLATLMILIMSCFVYGTKKRCFWLYIMAYIVFVLAILFLELGNVDFTDIDAAIEERGIKAVTETYYIKVYLFMLRIFGTLSMTTYLISTINYFRKKSIKE